MAKQLTFNLPKRQAHGFGDFLVTPSNQAAMAAIENWQSWPNKKLVLVGEEGTGKTHLTHIWAEMSAARIISARALTQTNVSALGQKPIAIEDADRIACIARAEAALFHLHNLLLSEGHTFLITARKAPSRWGLSLPDLQSRLEGTTLAQLDAPDDMLLSAVLVKLFDDRQITAPTSLIEYLVPRMERSLSEAARLVDELDHMALSEGRAPSRVLAARLLDKDA